MTVVGVLVIMRQRLRTRDSGSVAGAVHHGG